jgi:hypothetical protein
LLVAQGTDGAGNLQQRAEIALHAGGLRKRRKFVRFQAEKLLRTEFQSSYMLRFVLVHLHWTARCALGCFGLKEENRISHRDFVAGLEFAALHGDSVDERAGAAVEIAEDQLSVLDSYGAVVRGDR